MAYTPNSGINSLDALIQLKMLEQMPDTEMVQAPVERPTSTPMPQSDGSPQGIAGLLTRYAESKLSGDQPIQMADGGSIMDSLSDRVMGKTTNSIMDSLSDRVMGNVDNNEYENNYDYSYEYTPYASRLSDVAEPEPMLSYSPQDAALSDLYSENFDFGGDDAVAGTGGTSTGATSTGGISAAQNASNQSVAQAVSTSMMGQVAPGLSNAMGAVQGVNALGSQFGMGVPGLGPAIGIANASPIGVFSGLMSLAIPGPLGLIMGAFGKGVSAISSGKAMDAMVGLGIASNSYGPGENVGGSGVSGGQTSGAGTTTGGPTGIGMTGHNDVHGSPMATDPNAEQAAGVAADVAATAEAVDTAAGMGSVGDGGVAAAAAAEAADAAAGMGSVGDGGASTSTNAGPGVDATGEETGGPGSGTGGDAGDDTVICTELHRQGRISDEVYASDSVFGLRMSIEDPDVMSGYSSWAIPVVGLMQKSKLVTEIVAPFGKAWAKEMHYQETGKGQPNLLGRVIMRVGVPMCRFLGKKLNYEIKHA